MRAIRLAAGLTAFILAAVITGTTAHSQGPAPTYTLVDLGTHFPEAINGAGQIAGEAPQSGTYYAFRWQNGAFETVAIPLSPGGGMTVNGINDAGHIVGGADVAAGGRRGYLWNGATTTVLDTLGGADSAAYAINSLDQVVGLATVPSGQQRAVIWNGSTPVDLGSLGGRSFANGINDVGQVVGQADLGNGVDSHAFLYDNGIMTDLGTLGGSQSTGYAIRNDGLILGFSSLAGDEVSHPFLWENGVMTDLGGMPGTTGTAELVNTINSHRDMVGYSQLTLGGDQLHAVLYRNGTYTDLNTVLPPGSGWSLYLAERINDAGQIVGIGFLNGEAHGFLLNPVGATVGGGNVTVSQAVELPDHTTAPVTIQLESVVTGGQTTITASNTGPAAPSGFRLPDPPLFFDVQTTAVVSGAITLCFSWVEGALQNEANARLLHFDNGQWMDITTSVDMQANTVCGLATSLSPFVIAELGYQFLGFKEPLLPGGSASIQQSKGGRTIPVKFQLASGGQLTGAATATIAVHKVLDVAVGSVDTTEYTADAGQANDTSNQFRYVAEAQQYIFNLSTKGWAAPATYRIFVTLSDGTAHTIDFSLRK